MAGGPARQPQPPVERQHEGLGGLGDSFTPSGVVRHACRHRVAALLGLFWRLLREGRLKVTRGRSWQPEIGMEHASRGRRSGNKGVGARWRGRFRIFSARHCSRTKVSHAENSGMTMLFFSLEVAPMSEGDSFTGSGVVRHACRHRVAALLGLFWRLLRESGGGRGSPRLAWSMPPGVGVLEIRAWEPAGAGDSGYFPRGIVPGPRSATRKIPE